MPHMRGGRSGTGWDGTRTQRPYPTPKIATPKGLDLGRSPEGLRPPESVEPSGRDPEGSRPHGFLTTMWLHTPGGALPRIAGSRRTGWFVLHRGHTHVLGVSKIVAAFSGTALNMYDLFTPVKGYFPSHRLIHGTSSMSPDSRRSSTISSQVVHNRGERV